MSRPMTALVILLLVYSWIYWDRTLFFVLLCTILYSYIYFRRKGHWPLTSFLLTLASGGSREPVIEESKPKITFADVAGIDEAKEELLEIVDFLKNKDKYSRVGARLPRGLILIGSPGVGKTLCAKAIAGEAGVTLIEVSGSSFVEKYVGVGASSVRELFARAKRKAPCIVFIDEFDSLGRRGEGENNGGGGHEYDQTINQLLVEMDGFSSDINVVVVAATNRIDKIDEALLRPGRLDRKVYLHRPDINGREAILKIHAKNKPLSSNVDLQTIARITPGFTGADLANLLNEAAIGVVKTGKSEIEHSDIILAKDKIILGKEKKLAIDDQEKRITAYHEAGHAILAAVLENCDPPDKVTIIPRDMALGVTSLASSKDRYNVSKSFLLDQVVMLLGGRGAEKIVFGEETAGAKNDIERATDIITAMVCEYGMSENLGPIAVNISKSPLGASLTAKAHEEIIKLLKESYDRAIKILREHRVALDEIVHLLLEKETISGEEIVALLSKKP